MYLYSFDFRYKLTGSAAVKAKNVYLSLVDGHQTLCKHGVVQLFTHPHPPKQYQTVWSSRTPPRIYSQSEVRRRLTRSTEDLSNKYLQDYELHRQMRLDQTNNLPSPSRISVRSNSKIRTNSPNIPDDVIAANIERSTSLHSNVQKSQNQIILPKDYNPVAAITAVENMEIFLSKTFYNNFDENIPQNKINYSLARSLTNTEEGVNAFTNKIFSERFEENLMKDTKRLHNHNHKNLFVQNSTRNYKEIISDHRHRELQVIACIIVEIFLAKKLRPLGSCTNQSFEERTEACRNVLKADFDLLPKCVQYPVKLLFSFGDVSNTTVTDIGLPKPSPNQLLQPFLNNFLFPFPHTYLKVYALIKSLQQYELASKLLETFTYFDCDGSSCINYELLDITRVAYKRKIAECKVMSAVVQIEGLLRPCGYEQFNLVEIILPHIIELLCNSDTSILTAWYLFDSVAAAMGIKATQKYLLEPILKLYETENDERINFLNSNFDSSMKFTTSSTFKSEKSFKLYHHSFLLRLIVRFGLKCFLNNFVSPLIEAIGGYKEPINSTPYHYHDDTNCMNITKSKSTKNLKMCSNDNDMVTVESSAEIIETENDDMFTFENECDDGQKTTVQINLTDSSDNDGDALNRIIDQFEISMTGGS